MIIQEIIIRINNKNNCMQKKNQTNNSINEILEMFKMYQNDNFSQVKNKDPLNQTRQHFESQEFFSNSNPFSFSQSELKICKVGALHSSLQKIQKQKHKTSLNSNRQGLSCFNDTFNKNIFERLYDENKSVKQKRQRLIQQGRKSLQAKQIKQCTFSPNIRLKLNTQRSCNVDDIQAFYQKNINWQTKKLEEIKKKQCQKNNQDKNQLTFVPKINPCNFKKDKENKENHKKTAGSYLNIYQKHAEKQQEEAVKKNAYKSIWNSKKGYFSYAR